MALSPQSIQAALQAIEQHQRILISPHANVDPDGLSSALACYQIFTAMGKEVTVICPDTKPDSLSFLPGFEKLEEEVKENKDFVVTINLDEGAEIDKLRYTVEDHRVNIIVVPKKGRIRSQQISLSEGESKYDLLVIVDTADLALLGSLYTEHVDLFADVPILNIDHHISNTNYGQLQMIDPTAASATEVLYNWFLQVPQFRDKITPDLATLLLTGLITDTRSFQNPNTTPRSLEVAAELLEKGARQQEIIQHIYKTKPLSTLKIWGRALNHIQVDPQSRIVWSSISKEDLAEMEATSKETHGILDELISTIPDADVYVLFTEMEDGGLKASMRSTAAIDVSQLAARTYGGGGHARASGFRVKSFDNFQLQVLECIQKLKEGIQKQRDEDAQREQELAQKAASVPALEIPKAAPAPVPPQKTGVDLMQKIEKTDADGKERDIVKDVTKS
ncbi:MAG TPA: bifunctional oligoribonuclease/PAP phosphatase NrnA [Candidatus Peribacteraceae bacterium]|nr:bifunctional oligoribonuclease/PAP phosphatase NrnA [Candidatus Peribacteraceae bacterium]